MRTFSFCCGVLLIAVFAANCARASYLDQYQDQNASARFVIAADCTVAQTFTPSMTGKLQEVQLKFGNSRRTDNMPQYPVTVSIAATVDSKPSSTILGALTISTFTDGWTSADFSGLSVFLTAGTKYAIVISSNDTTRYDATSTQWHASTTNLYSNGSMWVRYPSTGWVQSYEIPGSGYTETYYDKDGDFRTYMVPEPACMGLLLMGSLLLRKKR
jgi:hypothetical protein